MEPTLNRKMTSSPSSLPLSRFQSSLTCDVCRGYLIDATTIIECMHTCKYSFSRPTQSLLLLFKILQSAFIFFVGEPSRNGIVIVEVLPVVVLGHAMPLSCQPRDQFHKSLVVSAVL